ncbi:MAG: c-type cytochrome [Polyangiaceae bacterium]
MLRKIIRISAVVVAVLVVVGLGLAARAKWVLDRSYADVPEPPIVADRSPQAVARGEMLFQSLCMECHGGTDGRATGKSLEEIPAFLGQFWSANLAHPEHGVHTKSDGKIARVLRNGVLPDGSLSVVMNGFGHIGDADVAALLGYMRSGSPPFVPGGDVQPRTQVSLLGAMIVTYVSRISAEAPASGVIVPAKAADVTYGKYMATVMDCVGCHTDGFGSDKMNEEGRFAGGFELTDPTGAKIYTKNITFDEATGIGKWSLADFERAVTRGARPDGYLVRKPMPLFSRLDHTDVSAIYAFLRTVPAVHRENRVGGHPLEKARPSDPPQVLFDKLGCSACHGDKAPYRNQIAGALGKPDADVAAWILDPQATKPGSPMPSFRDAIDSAQAETLARYVKELASRRGG